MAAGSLYFAWRNRDFRKFLAGAFFVSSGILFYLYLADVSVPLLGTSFVETPQISGGRSIVHFILFLLCFYFGFVRKPKAWNGHHVRWRRVGAWSRIMDAPAAAHEADVQVIETPIVRLLASARNPLRTQQEPVREPIAG
jgi:uncharacterized protein (DUF486 family)